jgi:hypothetical protein
MFLFWIPYSGILDYFFGIKNSSRFEIKQKYPIHSKKVLQVELEVIS